MNMKALAQEHSMGCGPACVAVRMGITYAKALELFTHPHHAWTQGYYCSEITEALSRGGFKYVFSEFRKYSHKQYLQKNGSIAFIAKSDLYPAGHFLLKVSDGWMNPWINFPHLMPIRFGIQKNCLGKLLTCYMSIALFESAKLLGINSNLYACKNPQ